MPDKISPVTISLLEWLDDQLKFAVSPECTNRAERHPILQKMFIVIREDCGYYKERNFSLGDKGRKLFTQCDHWMSVLDSLV